MNVEEHLRTALAARVAEVPETGDLAGRAVARAGRIRGRRRAMAIAASVVAVVAVAFAVVRLGSPPVSLPADPPSISATPPPGRPTGLKVDLIHGLVLHRASGGTVALPHKPNLVVTDAVRAAGGWLITYQRNDDQRSQVVELVREDGTAKTLGVAPDTAVVVDHSGKRAVVQYWNNGGQVATAVVVDLPSGNVITQTPLPAGDGSMVVRAWSRDAVVLSRMSGDTGAVPVDLWDPTRGPYVASPRGEFVILGRFGTAGHLIAMAPDPPQKACLVELDPANQFAVLRKSCGREWERPSVSPDGWRQLNVDKPHWTASAPFSDDPRPTPLGTVTSEVPDVHWESAEVVLINGHSGPGLIRCEVTGAPCETIVVPGVDTKTSVIVRTP